ncbi:MAG: hemerythrin family protein [Alphaproteobacteria bacterium]|nr:hemerythrin family protein [Alphaproteobacteria bacterium]MBF0249999.1 hemerythrin family protein [Alphaproteobacteria bacterium]
MRHIKWFDDYDTGIEDIDTEHRRLAEHLNEFFATCDSSCEPAVMVRILETLLRETQRHFAHEEEIMAKVGFPGLDGHRVGHTALIDELHDTIDSFRAGVTAELTAKTTQMLEDWLLHHILNEDKKIGKHTGAID